PTPRVSRRYTSRGASRRSSGSRQRTASGRKRSAAAWRRSYSRKGAKTVTVWCSRLNWCGCWTDWRKKSGQTA
ncbi:hypothetical protein BTQ05_18360, partial [Escherichia coli]